MRRGNLQGVAYNSTVDTGLTRYISRPHSSLENERFLYRAAELHRGQEQHTGKTTRQRTTDGAPGSDYQSSVDNAVNRTVPYIHHRTYHIHTYLATPIDNCENLRSVKPASFRVSAKIQHLLSDVVEAKRMYKWKNNRLGKVVRAMARFVV